MEVYRTEEEQVAAIKNWYQRHGTKIVVALAIALALFFGYQYYKNKQQAELEKSSIIYGQLLSVMEQGNLNNEQNKAFFDELYGYLSTDHKDTIYASYAALLRASQDVKNDDYGQAEQTLSWVLQQKNPKIIDALARLRLARVKAANGEADQALALLDKPSSVFSAEYAEAKGDIYYSQNKRIEALKFYKQAKAESANKKAGTILDMKINSLNEDPEAIVKIKLAAQK